MSIDGLSFLRFVKSEHILGDSHFYVALTENTGSCNNQIVVDSKNYEIICTKQKKIYASKSFSVIYNVFSGLHDVIYIAIVAMHPKSINKLFIMVDDV